MTSQGRRKHSAYLFRIRESCPFRKLRRNKCSDSRHSVVLIGGQWATSQTQATAMPSGSNKNIEAGVSVETFSKPAASLQSVSHPQEQVSAMDTDTAPSTASSSYRVSAAAEGSNFSLINQQPRNLSSSDTSMDLDSGVDPETGERAQG